MTCLIKDKTDKRHSLDYKEWKRIRNQSNSDKEKQLNKESTKLKEITKQKYLARRNIFGKPNVKW